MLAIWAETERMPKARNVILLSVNGNVLGASTKMKPHPKAEDKGRGGSPNRPRAIGGQSPYLFIGRRCACPTILGCNALMVGHRISFARSISN